MWKPLIIPGVIYSQDLIDKIKQKNTVPFTVFTI